MAQLLLAAASIGQNRDDLNELAASAMGPLVSPNSGMTFLSRHC